MQENTDQKISKHGSFLRSDMSCVKDVFPICANRFNAATEWKFALKFFIIYFKELQGT